MNRAELKSKAKESLKGKYGNAVGIIIIFMLISVVASACVAIPVIGFIIPTLVICIIGFGYLRFFLKISRGENVSVNELWSCANMWWLYFIISVCSGFFTFAWSLLFVIPGIIASYRYRMALYIALDNPDISGLEAIKKSKEMMNGHKWELFVLDLSFIGWYFLCGLTFGILLFYVVPYMGVTVANFYNSLKEKNDNINNNTMNYTQPVVPSYTDQPTITPVQDNSQSQNAFVNEQPVQPMQSMQQESQPFQVPPVTESNASQNTDNTVI